MKQIKLLIGTTLCVALAASGGSQVTKSGKNYLVRLKYQTGQKITYDLITEARYPGLGGSAKVTSGLVVDVKSVSKEKYNVVFTVLPAMVGKEQRTKKATVNATVDSRNRIIKSSAKEGSAPDMLDLAYPDKPIAPGFTWETASIGGFKDFGNVTARTTYKFVGVKTVNGVSVAEISVSQVGTQQSTIVTGKGTILLRTADGSFESSTMNVTARPADQPAGTNNAVRATVSLIRKKSSK